MNQTSKKTKPPACDACKARRVLCHRQPNGLPCPRCVEKGVLCKTTPVPRGRPRKNPSTSSTPSNESSTGSKCPTYSTISFARDNLQAHCSSSLAIRHSHLDPSLEELSAELVQHLFDCFAQSPYLRLPLFRRIDLTALLSAASWNLDVLPPDARVLAYCICAQATLISFHPSVIGPGPKPKSLTDRSVLFRGADLRLYGVRRTAAFKSLHEKAINLACEARIHLQVSECNAASCFVLGNLDESPSRPWTVAYMSHIRNLFGCLDGNFPEADKVTWSAFLMVEALQAILEHKPVIHTYADQILLIGSEPQPLDRILENVRPMAQASSTRAVARIVYATIGPVLFHVGRLSREMYDKISGAHARRQPIAETVVIDFLSSLAILQSVISVLFTQVNWKLEPQPILSHPPYHTDEDNIRSCACAMSVGFTSLVITLHRELGYRNTLNMCDGQQDRWTMERMAFLRRRAHAMASSAVEDVARFLRLSPYPPDFMLVTCSGVFPWAYFCLDEADAAGGIEPDRILVFEWILDMLKALGYSRDSQQLNSLVERMEAHVTARNAMDLLPSQSLALLDMPFPIDDTWIGMFPFSVDGDALLT